MKLRNTIRTTLCSAALFLMATQLPVFSFVENQDDTNSNISVGEQYSPDEQGSVLLAQQYNVDGEWQDNYGSECYVSQFQQTSLAWHCIDPSANKQWTTMFIGELDGDEFKGRWQDVPPGRNRLAGEMSVKIVSNNRIEIVSKTGGYGSSYLTRP